MRISLLALGLLLSFPALAEALDPAAIMRAVRDRDEGQDRRSEVTLVQTMADGHLVKRGTRLVAVMPGRVFTSRMVRLSSGPRIKSARL